MSQYIFLKVKEIIKETSDAITIVFNKPGINVSYKPGQFLTFILDIGGEKLRRSYSLCSSPYLGDDWAVSVKKVQGGKVSTYLLDQLKVGDVIETMAPAGIFTYEPLTANTNDIVLVGAGSGITPLYSILSSALAVEKNSRVFLLYANRNEESVILKKGIEDLKAKYSDRFQYILFYSASLKASYVAAGRMDKGKIKDLLSAFKGINFNAAHFYVCGPQGMMDETFHALDLLKVPHDHVRKESFTSGTDHKTSTVPVASTGGAVVVGIRYNKQDYKINVAPGQTILEAALDQDIDLPYSCQSGMCTACMGKCKKGQIKMEDPDGLSENEIKQGFVLTCVGRPLTEDVLIEID